ncbi:MAG: shikimate kinase [Bacteroidales bacterium]|jgi:shikimate kinase|nr:shikimate kinase [Bacteroidales bacterium]
MIISLTGFMGVGKSTIAEKLSTHLFCNYTDLDRYIETSEGRRVEELFRDLGESAFREIEERALERLLSVNREKMMVLSLGGGALMSLKSSNLIKRETKCIYLRADIETLIRRLIKSRKSRPLVSAELNSSLRERVTELFNRREEGYLRSASIIIDVDNLSIKETLERVLSVI